MLSAGEGESVPLRIEPTRVRDGGLFFSPDWRLIVVLSLLCWAQTSARPATEGWLHHLGTDPVATFTALLFCATLLLWWSTRSLVKGAETTAKHQLRAYVFPTLAEVQYPTPRCPAFRVVIKNFGQTPANDYAATPLAFRLAGTGVSPEGEVAVRDQPPLRGSIPPNGVVEVTIEFQKPLTSEQWDALTSGSKFLYISGEIRYTDVFNDSRSTKFCFALGGHYGTGEGRLAYADEGNVIS
jgi:hypothetical protein